MREEWSVAKDKRLLHSPKGISISLIGNAEEILPFDSLALVLIDYRDIPLSEAGRNVYAFSEDGDLLWQIAAIPEDDINSYVEIRRKSDSLATLHNWASFYRLVDVKTGAILRTVESR